MKPIKLGIVSFPYGAKYRTGGIHKGIDYAARINTPVFAAVPGVVVHAGRHIYKKGWGWSFGNHVIVANDNFADGTRGYWAGYCHLNGVNVRVGQRVRQGQLLGTSGNTGRSSGPHLHFEIQTQRYWSPVRHKNPDKWIKA